MNEFIASSIKGLSIDGLTLLVRDCEQRIGSNVAGGMPNETYIENQKGIINLVQEELLTR